MIPLLRRILVLVGIVLFRVGLARLIIHATRSRVRVLLYHYVGPPAPAFFDTARPTLSVEQFEQHLELITRYYSPVALSDLGSSTLPDKALLVTFDDGFRCLATHALVPLRDRAIRPTVFLIGSAVGNGQLVWTQEVAWTLNRYGKSAWSIVAGPSGPSAGRSVTALLHQLWQSARGDDIRDLLARLRARLGYDAEGIARDARLYLDWDEIDLLISHGWSFGSHTANHFSLAALDPKEQEREIEVGSDLVRNRLGSVTAFAYPFGDRTEHARSIALRSGHTAIMEVGGVNPRPLDLSRIGRVPAEEAATQAELFAEIEIVAPVKAMVMSLRVRIAELLRAVSRHPRSTDTHGDAAQPTPPARRQH
jgi:peptidoglycan/xylan/chitin deacetylase (PgdA/CDA1 family)